MQARGWFLVLLGSWDCLSFPCDYQPWSLAYKCSNWLPIPSWGMKLCTLEKEDILSLEYLPLWDLVVKNHKIKAKSATELVWPSEKTINLRFVFQHYQELQDSRVGQENKHHPHTVKSTWTYSWLAQWNIAEVTWQRSCSPEYQTLHLGNSCDPHLENCKCFQL